MATPRLTISDPTALIAAVKQTPAYKRPGPMTLPVLTCVRVAVSGPGPNMRVSWSSTDLDVTVCYSVQTFETDAAGFAACINARELVNALTALKGAGPVSITLENEHPDPKATVAALSGVGPVFNMTTISAEEFPTVPDQPLVNMPLAFPDPRAALDVLARVSTFASSDETRPSLSGVFAEPDDGGLTATATDGHRLMTTRVQLDPVVDRPRDTFIMPRQVAALVLKLIPKKAAPLSVCMGVGAVLVRYGDAVAVAVTYRLHDGPFPNYRQVIPHDTAGTVTFSADALAAAAKAADKAADKLTHQMVLKPNGGAAVDWEANRPDVSRAAGSIPVVAGALPFVVGYNARYVSDMVAAFGADALRFDFTTAAGAAIVRPVGAPSDTLALLMPLRHSA